MSFKLQRSLTAILFLIVLVVGVLYLALGYRGNVRSTVASVLRGEGDAPVEDLFSLSDRIQAATGRVEQSLIDTLDRDRFFIESYGLVQRLMGRQVMEDTEAQYTVARLSNGALTFVDPNAVYSDPTQRAQALIRFRDRLTEKLDIPLLYVQAPQKASVYASAALPDGLYDYGDDHADALLTALKEADIDTLDLRPVFAQTGQYDELFFRTDHHWTPEGAFLAWQTVAEALERDYSFTIDDASTDLDCWEVETLEDLFLGSQGKRVGPLYAGMDDFELWSPKEEGHYQYIAFSQGYDRTGSFETSLLFPERLDETDPYKANPYTYYSGGDYSFTRMKNLDDPDGPTIVLLRDSFACTFAPFMATGFGEVVTIDLRYFHDDLMEYISWVGADMVVFLYSPGSVKLDTMFTFDPPVQQEVSAP